MIKHLKIPWGKYTLGGSRTPDTVKNYDFWGVVETPLLPIRSIDDMIKCIRPMCLQSNSLGCSVPWTIPPFVNAALRSRDP
jgi:hypothetical protein